MGGQILEAGMNPVKDKSGMRTIAFILVAGLLAALGGCSSAEPPARTLYVILRHPESGKSVACSGSITERRKFNNCVEVAEKNGFEKVSKPGKNKN